MTHSEMVRLIKDTIRQELVPTILGVIYSNETEARSTVERYPIEPPRSNVRTMAPYGFASKAPKGTPALIMAVGNDTTNQNVIGHYDETGRPPLQDGDVALYDAFGNVFLISNGKFQLGSETSSQNMVLGLELQTFLAQLLELIATHTHPGIGSPPSNASMFEQLKSSPVNDGAILSQKSFTE